MATPWSETLYDFPQFRGLQTVGDAFGVRFRLYGGAASRLAMALVHSRERAPSLVDLAPFTSDIDLQHSGDDALNSEIQAAIDAIVPEAAWCRWSIIGRQAASVAAERRATSAYVPLRGVLFDSWRAAPIDDLAWSDLQNLHVSISPNPQFAESKWRQDRLDLEIFSLMMALNAASDLATTSGGSVGIETKPAVEILERFTSGDDGQVLAETPRLRRRAYYLSAPLAARSPRIGGSLAGVLGLIQQFAPLAVLPEPGRAMVVSAALADSSFRAPTQIGVTRADGERDDWTGAFGRATEVRLDPVFELGSVSEVMPLQAGAAPSSGLGWDGRPREFLHLAWSGQAEEPTATTAIALDENGNPHLGAAVGGSFGATGRWLRIDVGPAHGAKTLRVLMLRGRAAKASEPEPDRLPTLGSPGIELVEPQDERQNAYWINDEEDAEQEASLTSWTSNSWSETLKDLKTQAPLVQLLQSRVGEGEG